MGDFNDSKAYPEDPVFLPSVLVDIASAMTLGGDASEASASRYKGTVGKSPKTAAIILAGGSGERFGHEGGKQLVEIFLTRNIVGAGCRNTARRRKRTSLVVSQLRRFMASGLT